MSKAAQRLRALERIGHRRHVLGLRVFVQSLSDPGVYHESKQPRGEPEGEPYDMAAIDALGAAGWQCITICYEPAGSESDTIQLKWET